MPLEIVRGNITDMQEADVVVLMHDPFIEGLTSIYGPDVCNFLDGRKKLGVVPSASLEICSDSIMQAKYVVYVLISLWINGNYNEANSLRQGIEQSLWLAMTQGCKSIAFAMSSIEIFGFPKPLAMQIAFQTIKSFLFEHEMQVYWVIPCESSTEHSKDPLASLDRYIEANYVTDEDYSICLQPFIPYCFCETGIYSAEDLDVLLERTNMGFTEKLLEYIEREGISKPKLYKRAHLDRRHLDKYINKMDWNPKKPTAIALAIALELDLDETLDLIGSAGHALLHNSRSDLIIEYHIKKQKYDLDIINDALIQRGLPPIYE